MIRQKPGPKPKPLELPEIPQQARPVATLDEGRPETRLTWYLTVTRKKDKAYMLDVARRLNGQGYVAWCPLCIQQRTHARKTFLQVEPLFAPILFVGLLEGQGIGTMVKTIGVADVMRSDGRLPLRISVVELGQMWDECQKDGGAKMLARVQRGPWFKKDDAVRITSGPLMDYPAIFSWCSGERVQVLLDMAGRVIHVETTLDKLERIS